MRKANYGIDAPTVVRNFLLFGVIAIAVALSVPALHGFWRMGVVLIADGLFMIWGSKFWKLRLRDKIINSIPWRGDEQVLDVGCGSGLMLIAAAKRLTSGMAHGVDLWQQVDQSGNSASRTNSNAELEGVSDRIKIHEGDMRELPFPDRSIDVVVSSWAIHNIDGAEERKKALLEIVRVLKPGGQLAIADIRHTRAYAKVFTEHGLLEVRRSWPNFLFIGPTFTVMAKKGEVAPMGS